MDLRQAVCEVWMLMKLAEYSAQVEVYVEVCAATLSVRLPLLYIRGLLGKEHPMSYWQKKQCEKKLQYIKIPTCLSYFST
jgi:hypothetical protein